MRNPWTFLAKRQRDRPPLPEEPRTDPALEESLRKLAHELHERHERSRPEDPPET